MFSSQPHLKGQPLATPSSASRRGGLTRSAGLLLLVGLATGCPTPPDASGPTTPGGNSPAAGGNMGGPPQNGGAANSPGQGGTKAGGPPPDSSGPPEPVAPPVFDTSGDTITLTVTVTGGTTGQVDFMTLEDGNPRALHVATFEGSKAFKVTAPAKLDAPIYVAAMNYSNGKGLSENDEHGHLKDPIKLVGKDISLTVKMGETADWMPAPDPNLTPPHRNPMGAGKMGSGQASGGQGGAGSGGSGAGGQGAAPAGGQGAGGQGAAPAGGQGAGGQGAAPAGGQGAGGQGAAPAGAAGGPPPGTTPTPGTAPTPAEGAGAPQ